MALILIAGASYAAYAARQNAETAETDESISFQGKTRVKLLAGGTSGIMELPLTCLNWFAGDYRTVARVLEERVALIVQKNPFLAGWLFLDKDKDNALSLLYDETGGDVQQGWFRVYDYEASVDGMGIQIPNLSHDTTYEETTLSLKAMGAMLPLQHEMIGKDKMPLFRVSIIPDAHRPTEKFALVVSMAHALGDAHTFYQLVKMLDTDAVVLPLIVERDTSLPKMARQKMGDEAFDYLATAVKEPPLDLTANREEPCVMKAFHVKEPWFAKKDKRARRASLFNEVAQDYNSTNLSENSILASWFFNLSKPDIAFMGLSLRDRFLQEGCPVSHVHAGNYVAGIPYTPVDYATPALIEHSVAQLKRCGVVEIDTAAGQGSHTTTTELPPFRWNNSASISLNWAHRFQDKLQLLPSDMDCQHLSHLVLYDAALLKAVPGRLSLCYMFTSVPGDKSSTAAMSTEDAAALVAKETEELEASGRNDKNDEQEPQLHGKRAGVIVVCRQSVWKEIEASGIIDEMIIDA